jgi:hypothetical protein
MTKEFETYQLRLFPFDNLYSYQAIFHYVRAGDVIRISIGDTEMDTKGNVIETAAIAKDSV